MERDTSTTAMIDFNADLYNIDYQEYSEITDKLFHAIGRNQSLGKYVTPLLIKLTDFLDGNGSIQKIPS